MTDHTPGRAVVVAAQLILLFAVAACGRTDTASGTADETAAANENVEAMAREHFHEPHPEATFVRPDGTPMAPATR